MSATEQAQFLAVWEHEAQASLQVMRSLPADRYDFRPAPGMRTLGELAWHIAEVEAYMSDGVATGRFDFTRLMPGLERPVAAAGLVPGYERVHAESVARIAGLAPEAIDRPVVLMGHERRAADILWYALIQHVIHHRGQLVLMCRMAGGTPPGLYGPNQEEMAAMRRG